MGLPLCSDERLADLLLREPSRQEGSDSQGRRGLGNYNTLSAGVLLQRPLPRGSMSNSL